MAVREERVRAGVDEWTEVVRSPVTGTWLPTYPDTLRRYRDYVDDTNKRPQARTVRSSAISNSLTSLVHVVAGDGCIPLSASHVRRKDAPELRAWIGLGPVESDGGTCKGPGVIFALKVPLPLAVPPF